MRPQFIPSLRLLIQVALAGTSILYLGELGAFPSPQACRLPLTMITSVCPEEHKVAYYGLRFTFSMFWIGFVGACIYWALGWLIRVIVKSGV